MPEVHLKNGSHPEYPAKLTGAEAGAEGKSRKARRVALLLAEKVCEGEQQGSLCGRATGSHSSISGKGEKL